MALLTRIPLSGVSRHYCKRSLLPLLALNRHPLRQCCEPSRAINYFLAQRFESERKMILNTNAGQCITYVLRNYAGRRLSGKSHNRY